MSAELWDSLLQCVKAVAPVQLPVNRWACSRRPSTIACRRCSNVLRRGKDTRSLFSDSNAVSGSLFLLMIQNRWLCCFRSCGNTVSFWYRWYRARMSYPARLSGRSFAILPNSPWSGLLPWMLLVCPALDRAQALMSNVLSGAQEKLFQQCPGLWASLLPLDLQAAQEASADFPAFFLAITQKIKTTDLADTLPHQFLLQDNLTLIFYLSCIKPSQMTLYALWFFAIKNHTHAHRDFNKTFVIKFYYFNKCCCQLIIPRVDIMRYSNNWILIKKFT